MDQLNKDLLQGELAPSEKLLWSGQPAQGFQLHAGDAMAIPCSIAWFFFAVYWEMTILQMGTGPVYALFGLPFILVYCLIFSDIRLPGIHGLIGAAYVGFFEMGITFVLWLTALRLSENTARVGYLIFLSPFLSLVFIHFLVGEDILGSTYLGLVLIVAGLIVQQVRSFGRH